MLRWSSSLMLSRFLAGVFFFFFWNLYLKILIWSTLCAVYSSCWLRFPRSSGHTSAVLSERFRSFRVWCLHLLSKGGGGGGGTSSKNLLDRWEFSRDFVRILLGFFPEPSWMLEGFFQDYSRMLEGFFQDSVRILYGCFRDPFGIFGGRGRLPKNCEVCVQDCFRLVGIDEYLWKIFGHLVKVWFLPILVAQDHFLSKIETKLLKLDECYQSRLNVSCDTPERSCREYI